MLSGEMFIGARRVRGTQGEFHGHDPRTGETLSPAYGRGGQAEVDEAVGLATEAFASYRRTGLAERAAFLETIATEIEHDGEAIVAQVIAETGIVEPRVRGELARTTGQLRLFADVVRTGSWIGARIDPPLPERSPLPRPDLRQREIPVGPVAVFGASNFPLAFSVAGGDTASALAAGCPVVVKAHESHPGTSELVAAAVQRAVAQHGLPEGVFSLLFGEGRVLGTALVAHPGIASVGFTGSRSGGLALIDVASRRSRPIPVHAEMSSTNPVFLLPGALAERAADIGRGYAGSLTVGVGQLCTNPGLVFAVEGAGLDEFLDAARVAVAETTGLPMLSTGIHGSFTSGVEALAGHTGVQSGGRGVPDGGIACEGVAALFVTDLDTFLSDEALREEVFGPASLVVRVPSVERLPEVLGELDGQLTATLHLAEADIAVAGPLLEELELVAGRIIVNDWPTGVEVGHAMVHGGPWPATSDGRTTSVGTLAIERFLRPVCYQNVPGPLLPAALDDANSWHLWRLVDGHEQAPR